MYGPDAVINMAAFCIRRARGVRQRSVVHQELRRNRRLYEGFVTKKCDGLRKAGQPDIYMAHLKAMDYRPWAMQA